jgi:hypothetical protein
LDNSEIKSLRQILGERVPPGSQLILIDGGALALLGSPSLTVDIDCVGDDVHPSELHRSIMQIDAEPVLLDRFVPLSTGGTWAGAMDALKNRWIPVFVLEHEQMPEGNKRLLQKGSPAFPHPFKDKPVKLPGWLK